MSSLAQKNTSSKRNLKNLRQRVVTAVILLSIVLTAFWQGGLLFVALVALVSVFMAFEWARMVQLENHRKPALLLTLFLLAFIAMTAVQEVHISLQWGCVLGFLAFLTCLYSDQKLLTIFGGYVYLAPALFAMLVLRDTDNGAWLIIYLASMVWLTDSFAMLVGKSIGGPRLAPVISPNKTWAGLIGGMIGAGLGSVAFGFFLRDSVFLNEAQLFNLFVLGMVLAVVAQLGDLLESAIKRRHDVKDSGSLLPGHGGILDRVDSLLVVMVVALGVLYLRAMGGALSSNALFVW